MYTIEKQLTGIKLTTFCKGFNNGFAGFTNLLFVKHSSIYKFTNSLRRQQNFTEVKIAQRTAGNPNTAKE